MCVLLCAVMCLYGMCVLCIVCCGLLSTHVYCLSVLLIVVMLCVYCVSCYLFDQEECVLCDCRVVCVV